MKLDSDNGGDAGDDNGNDCVDDDGFNYNNDGSDEDRSSDKDANSGVYGNKKITVVVVKMIKIMIIMVIRWC